MKTGIKLLLIVLLLSVNDAFAQSKVINSKVFLPGEELIYKVKWTFLRLGTITIKTESVEGNPDYLKIILITESNPTLFFIDTKEYNETIIDVRNSMSVTYYGYHKNGSEKIIIYTSYNEETGITAAKMIDDVTKKEMKCDTIYNSPRFVEGPSLFFFTRVFSKKGGTFNVPTMIEGKIENTKIIFTNEKKEFEVDSFPYPVQAKKYYGFADWEGGTSQKMSGEFSGWITDDEASILVYAELKILLGKLKLELESYSREPFKYNVEKTSVK